jgi:predicted neutral ceramidase superfamily lipid hydrolase
MKKVENRRSLLVFIVLLLLNIAICVTNAINYNFVSLIINVVVIMAICFVLGYVYCRCEVEKRLIKAVNNEYPIEIHQEQLKEIEKCEENSEN